MVRRLRVCAKITSGFGGSATGPDARPEGGSVSPEILDRPRKCERCGPPAALRCASWRKTTHVQAVRISDDLQAWVIMLARKRRVNRRRRMQERLQRQCMKSKRSRVGTARPPPCQVKTAFVGDGALPALPALPCLPAGRQQAGGRQALPLHFMNWPSNAYSKSANSKMVGPSVVSRRFRRTRCAVTGSNRALSRAPSASPR